WMPLCGPSRWEPAARSSSAATEWPWGTGGGRISPPSASCPIRWGAARTGDLARHRKDGRVDYLGRSDHQVKVRGVRIELGEIEAVLRSSPAVAEAVAAVREDAPGDRRLVAYLVPAPGAAEGDLSVGALRRHLAARLPEAMIPSAFVPLVALPLTQSGKIDRRALPAPEAGRPRLDSDYAAPRTPNEKTLAAVWQEVLGRERIGIHDNFFE